VDAGSPSQKPRFGNPRSTAAFARIVERAGEAAEPELLGSPAHAAPCLWVRAGQQRRGYTSLAGLTRASEYSAHGAVYGVGAGEVQGLLAMTRDIITRSLSLGFAFSTQRSSSCGCSQSISSRIRWQDSFASRRRSPSRGRVCVLNNTATPHSSKPHFLRVLHRTTCFAIHDRNTTGVELVDPRWVELAIDFRRDVFAVPSIITRRPVSVSRSLMAASSRSANLLEPTLALTPSLGDSNGTAAMAYGRKTRP
jgi:hypothetical protein